MNGISRKYWIVLVVIALGLVAWTAPVGVMVAPYSDLSKPTSLSCESLAKVRLKDTTITLAAIVAKGAQPPGLPSFPVEACRVVGVIKPTSDSNINLEVWLPTAGWNGKFNGVGNGGFHQL